MALFDLIRGYYGGVCGQEGVNRHHIGMMRHFVDSCTLFNHTSCKNSNGYRTVDAAAAKYLYLILNFPHRIIKMDMDGGNQVLTNGCDMFP